MQRCDIPPRFAQRGIWIIVQDTGIVLYRTPVRKINLRRMWNFRFRQIGESVWVSFRQFHFCLAIGEWRSVSVNPARVRHWTGAACGDCCVQIYDFSSESLHDQGEIGRGAYGAVNKMVHEASGTIMAVKVSRLAALGRARRKTQKNRGEKTRNALCCS